LLPHGISFHDAIITAAEHVGSDIRLGVEGVQVAGAPPAPDEADFALTSGTLTFAGVHDVVINDVRTDAIAMGGDDGEILRLDWGDGGWAELFVIWSRYAGRRQHNSFYKIACADLIWTQAAPA
jgi:hypothetical protein